MYNPRLPERVFGLLNSYGREMLQHLRRGAVPPADGQRHGRLVIDYSAACA
jgi:hypothetical protein